MTSPCAYGPWHEFPGTGTSRVSEDIARPRGRGGIRADAGAKARKPGRARLRARLRLRNRRRRGDQSENGILTRADETDARADRGAQREGQRRRDGGGREGPGAGRRGGRCPRQRRELGTASRRALHGERPDHDRRHPHDLRIAAVQGPGADRRRVYETIASAWCSTIPSVP
jgi:hypothetical protein